MKQDIAGKDGARARGRRKALSWSLAALTAVAFGSSPAVAESASVGGDPDSKAETVHKVASTHRVCKISCTKPHAACAESERVIEVLKKIAAAYSRGDFVELSTYMDDDVTTFDEKNKKLIVGREAVISACKKKWLEYKDQDEPILSYTIDTPYAQVNGDTAVVTFKEVKTLGGAHPKTMVSKCTDIFVKKDGSWRKLHYRNYGAKELGAS